MNAGVMPGLDAALSAIQYPSGFLDKYDQLECLAHGHGTETFLVQKKGDTEKFIAKCYDLSVFSVVHESEILKSFSGEGLPAFADEYRNEAFACVVREYITGTPLNQYMAGRPLAPARAIAIAVQLCDILTRLHTRTPPVIHRDIKPQNVVIRPTGEAALIDFDIARVYADDSETDTQFIGTRAYAPPEQYGFSQTDCRTDIYSLGVLLCYMLSGHTDHKRAQIDDRRLAAIVRRCAAFSPEQRFGSVVAVKRALLRAGKPHARRLIRACAIALGLLAAGLAIWQYALPRAPAVTFAEPLMEKAVRAQLGKAEGERVTQEELLSVREIYLFGTEASATQDAFLGGMNGWTGARGSLQSLRDVALLPNLEVLYVNYQSLSDLAPVASLESLRYLDIRHTFVSELSPLSGMPKLAHVGLFDTNVADLSPLAACPEIKEIDIGYTMIGGVGAIPELPGLERLCLRGLPLDDLGGMERFARLTWLCLAGTGLDDLSPLLSLPRLREVVLDASMLGAAEALGNAAFDIEYE